MASPAQSQSGAPRQAECREPNNFPMLDAATGDLYSGVVKLCRGRIEDLTPGANAPAPGQMLFLVPGRTLSGAAKVGALVRAYPNRAYPIHPGAPRIMDGGMIWWSTAPQTSWEGVPYVLPFVPTTAGVVGQLDPGEDIYGYTDLIPLPGYQTAMAPLNSQSIIVGVAGLAFANANGLQAFLSGLQDSVPWVEILYVQKDEPRIQVRRAFIPLIPRASAAANWVTLVRQHPLVRPSERSTLAAYAAVGLALAALAAGHALAQGERHCQWVWVDSPDGLRSVEKCV